MGILQTVEDERKRWRSGGDQEMKGEKRSEISNAAGSVITMCRGVYCVGCKLKGEKRSEISSSQLRWLCVVCTREILLSKHTRVGSGYAGANFLNPLPDPMYSGSVIFNPTIPAGPTQPGIIWTDRVGSTHDHPKLYRKNNKDYDIDRCQMSC